jgi:O-antigen/teichoic acid export membrane protein
LPVDARTPAAAPAAATPLPDADAPAPPPPVPEASAALGGQTARGVVWFGLQTGVVKAVNLAGQLALAYLLAAEDFGHVGLTYTVGMLGSLVARAGVREVLISRGQDFARWANAAFWMSFVLGCAGTAVMLAAAPLAGWFYKDGRLPGLIAVLALQHVFTGLSAVPEAKLNLAMRFRVLALLTLANSTGLTALTVLFAWMGLKAYSFMLPWAIVAAARMAVVWWLAPHPVRRDWDVQHWRSMAGQNGLVFLSATFVAVTWQADYVVLGRLFPKETVGLYFWAFNLSTQALQLLSVNVAGVLLASLARLNAEPRRQRDGFLRAALLINTAGAAACFLQAAAAGPFIRLALEPQWYPAIRIVQVLSVGWAGYTVFHTVNSMLKAQGRFATLAWLTGGCAVLFVAVVYVAAVTGGVLGTAVGVLVYATIAGPVLVYMTVRPMGAGWGDVWRIFGPPTLVAAVSVGSVAALVSRLPPMPFRDAAALALTLLGGGVVWLLAVRVAMPGAYAQLKSYAAQVNPRRRPPRAPAAAPADPEPPHAP